MTVRWKPLLVLSGLFAVIAVVGLAAIAYTMRPRGSAQILPQARAGRAAGRFDHAQIHYRRALQADPRNAAIHEELAAMYGDWAAQAPAEKQAELRSWRLGELAEAAKYGRTLKGPRRRLLAEAMRQDEVPEGLYWAAEVLRVDPADADAHYLTAAEELDRRAPAVPEVKRHLAALEAAKAPEVRLSWLRARLAQVTGDAPRRDAVLARSRALSLPANADPVDRTALLRLRALDVETATGPAELPARVAALQAETRALAAAPSPAPNRVMRLSLLLERAQKSLAAAAASQADPAAKAAADGLVDAIEGDVEAIFQRTLAPDGKAGLHGYLTYAEHLRFRNRRDRCLEVVARGLKSPQAAKAAGGDVTLGLHAVAVEAALADTNDPKRFEIAAPHVAELIASASPRFQGLGHLFQGAIELEQSGVAAATAGVNPAGPDRPAGRLKPRAGALNHLKLAAAQLPDVVEAQARYGVALILSQEPGLGRQYLQNALRLGNAEPQYQIWAAWSMVQAGYPEEAEPIVDHLLGELGGGRVTGDLEGTLHLLRGEICQARRGPDDLRTALAEYERSAGGKAPAPGVQLRMAQIDVQLGQPDQALKRIERLRAVGQGGTAAEHLAVLTLFDQGRKDEALAALAKARAAYPDSDDLVGLEAAVLSRADRPKDADKVLADFLARDPENLSVVLMRAQLLADVLDDPKAARASLLGVADRAENSAPLVQLALLDLRRKDFDAVAGTIAKVRARWKDAAAADLLDAQLALERGDDAGAVVHFGAALRKDPGNKVVQFLKAQLETRTGASGDAARAFEALAKDGSTKQLDSGLSVSAAARSALANLSLQSGDVDGAIARFEGLRAGGLARGDRWQLVTAYAAKGEWAAARAEVAALLNDPKNPPAPDERVRAANLYRLNGDEPAAVAQLDYVLKIDPAQPAAVVTRAYMLSEAGRTVEAAALVRRALAAPRAAAPETDLKTAPAGPDAPPAAFYLMLAAFENMNPPVDDAGRRALAALDLGLAARPKSPELVQAKYRLLSVARGPKDALAFVQGEAKSDPKGDLRRVLAEVYREQGDLDAAEAAVKTLVVENPKDSPLAAALVRLAALQAARAGNRDDRDRERVENDKAAILIRDFRTKFPGDLAFPQEDCELAFRRGDMARATAITNEIDGLAKNSPTGPLLRARLFGAQDRPREAAEAYAEALRRNPRQPEVRLLLGQTDLRIGANDDAVRQARLVLDAEPDRADALLLEARALARPAGTAAETAARQAQALDRLNAAIKRLPTLSPAYHLIAEIRLARRLPAEAEAALRSGLAAAPDDALGLNRLVELLSTPDRPGGEPDPARLAAAGELARSADARDPRGNLALASAVGFQKAGRSAEALRWIEAAEAKLDTPAVHLNHGDILLALAERSGDAAEARGDFQKAVDQYDRVLKTQANSVEAVNNKAWILHSYLGQSKPALQLAQGLLARVDSSTLPGEFFDTLGAIQESQGRAGEAENSYSKGLRKSPDHPVLNYHMGRLIGADARRSSKAKGYLQKALDGRDRLTPSMAAEVASLMDRANTPR